MDRKLIEKFIQGKCSPEEALKIIKWLGEENYEAALEKMVSDDLEEAYDMVPFEYRDLSHIRKKILKQHTIGKPHKKPSHTRYRVSLRTAAVMAFFVVTGLLAYYFGHRSPKVMEDQYGMTEVIKSNPRGRKSTITLADGTTVYLNSESKIIYPDRFSDAIRIIQLEGEAFFEVAPDKNKPFIVRTNYLALRVLGTSFNVKTFNDSDEVTIALATGKVEITDAGTNKKASETVTLNPGQAVIFNKTAAAFGQISDFDPNYVYGWKDGLIYFDKASLREVIEKLERWYDVKIIVENKPSNKWVYKAYHKNESLELVLESMAHNEAFDFEIKDKLVTIKFK
ncbi:MAG: FecR domain-containing protein [Cytophagales bacterium]|nr:FecR domain-containing protein [Cytophagales bacterium]